MKMEMTPEEHARLHRRRGRQALGLLIAVLVLIGTLTVLHAGVSAVAKLFDDTAQRQEYEDKLEGLVLFDPVPFDGIENIDDLTLREAAVWGCVYSIQETQGGFDGYNTDPDTEQLLIPSVDVDAYLAKLVGPSFRMTHKTFEMEDMTEKELITVLIDKYTDLQRIKRANNGVENQELEYQIKVTIAKLASLGVSVEDITL